MHIALQISNKQKKHYLYTTDDLYAYIGDGEADKHALDASALQTHYEKQWLDRGLTIKYIKWQLTPLKEWSEPTIEIEKDSYRSYGRNYTCSTSSLES